MVLVLSGCNGQEKTKVEEKKDEGIEPKETSKVHKEYDEFGNLIRYDSIYSWSYSNIKGDSIKVNLDSIMNSFRNYFEESSPFEWNQDFSYFPKNDSLFMKDFFKEDYFFDHWKRQPLDFDEFLKRMDSTRNDFLRKFHPGLMDSNKESEHN